MSTPTSEVRDAEYLHSNGNTNERAILEAAWERLSKLDHVFTLDWQGPEAKRKLAREAVLNLHP